MAGCVFSGRLWPIHPKPLPDELLSSWIVRLSLAYGLKPYSLLRLVWPDAKFLRDSEVDRTTDERIWSMLAKKTGTPLCDAFQTTLSAYEGWLHSRAPKQGQIDWIMPINARNRPDPKRYGLQFCPLCLSEDVRPYFRRKWRLAFIFLCTKHRVMLLDRCPCCGGPVSYYNASQNHLRELGVDALTACQGCRFDLRNAAERVSLCAVNSDEANFQKSLADTLDSGWINVPKHGPVFSCLYFDGLNQLIRLLRSRRFPIRDMVIKHYGITTPIPVFPDYPYTLEMFDVAARRGVIALLMRILEDWPDQFIAFCETNRIWGRTLFSGMDYIPFWYWRVVYENLKRDRYWLTEKEFDLILSHARSKGLEPTVGEIGKYMHPRAASVRLRKAGLTRKGRTGLTGFPESLKQEAVRLYKEGNNFRQIGRILSVSSAAVGKWVKAYLIQCRQ